jgi:hypothetical protein
MVLRIDYNEHGDVEEYCDCHDGWYEGDYERSEGHCEHHDDDDDWEDDDDWHYEECAEGYFEHWDELG